MCLFCLYFVRLASSSTQRSSACYLIYFVLSCIAHHVFVEAVLPPLPHCDQSFTDTNIDYIAQNLQDASVYYLGDASSTTDCKQKCKSLNYLCGASESNANNFIYNDQGQSTFTFDNAVCELEIYEPLGVDWGSFILLTPDFVSSEYIIDFNFTILAGDEAGLVFKQSWAKQPGYWVMLSAAEEDLKNGEFGIDSWTRYAQTKVSRVSMNTQYNIQVHKEPNDLWSIYLDGALEWTSTESQKVSTPSDFVGVYAWNGHMRAHSLKVMFPNSTDEVLCAGYSYNKDNAQCYGYYGSDYSVLHSTLTSNVLYDSGIIEYEACPTATPSVQPTDDPTSEPSSEPIIEPTHQPTITPTKHPSKSPTKQPSKTPTKQSTKIPTIDPTNEPTINPTEPTIEPTTEPSSVSTTYSPLSVTAKPTSTTNITDSLSMLPTDTPNAEPSPQTSQDSDSFINDTANWITIAIIISIAVIGLCLLWLCYMKTLRKSAKVHDKAAVASRSVEDTQERRSRVDVEMEILPGANYIGNNDNVDRSQILSQVSMAEEEVQEMYDPNNKIEGRTEDANTTAKKTENSLNGKISLEEFEQKVDAILDTDTIVVDERVATGLGFVMYDPDEWSESDEPAFRGKTTTAMRAEAKKNHLEDSHDDNTKEEEMMIVAMEDSDDSDVYLEDIVEAMKTAQ